MLYTQVQQGRIFVLRLEDGEIVHKKIETFAQDQNIQAAAVIVLGGADEGSKLIGGPENGKAEPVVPLQISLEDVHEVAGTGTLFPDESGTPVLHLHMACGRKGSNTIGCIRPGVKVWQIMEVVLFELTGFQGQRSLDSKLGLQFLQL